MTYKERIETKLKTALTPILLEIKDDSALHAGHAGHNPLGETHFSILVVSPRFQDTSRVTRHRLVYDLLTDEMKERVHALRLHLWTPAEYDQREAR